MTGSDTEPEEDGDEPAAQRPTGGVKRRKSDVLDLSALNNEQAALATLESHQITHLTLRRRYYAEGLSFIRQVEGAMETVGTLLGSKAKAEVLEAMDFFRTAHEYEMDGAEVRAAGRLGVARCADARVWCRAGSRRCCTSCGRRITPR